MPMAFRYWPTLYRDFNEVIDDRIRHFRFAVISAWLKVLPSKLWQHWHDTAGSSVVIAAKPGSAPLSILFYPITLEGRRGTTDEFATIPFHLDLFSAALVELAKSIPVHSLILSSHLFFCLPLFLFPFTVPCRIVFAKPEDLEAWPNHLSFRFLTRVRSLSYSPMAAWIFLQTSSLVTWSLYEMFNSGSKACVLFSNSAVKVHDSQAYRNMEMARECISFTFDPRDMLEALYRLQFGNVGLCYRDPYHRRILELWTNCGLVAFGFHILWEAWGISVMESCCLVGPFCHCISVAVPGQLTVYGDSRYLAFEVFLKVSVNVIWSLHITFCLLVIWICSHLSGLNTICQICQSLSHSSRWSRSSCSDSASFWSRITLYSWPSSAKSCTDEETLEGRSLMYTRSRRGLSTVPCGTPDVTAAGDVFPSRTTCWFLSARKLLIQDMFLSLMP